MSLDGILFYHLANELNALKTGRISKIQEISDFEFLFTVRKNRVNYKLLISLTANFPRINLTERSFSISRQPKAFTMLLRKYFEGAIINDIHTHMTDRIMTIETSRLSELKDIEKKDLIIEIMGRYSNLIIVGNNTVIDALHHIGIFDLRSVLPNAQYEYPDTLKKINPFDFTKQELENLTKEANNPKGLCTKVLGLSYQSAVNIYDNNKSLYNIINENTPFLQEHPKRDITYFNSGNGIIYESYSKLIDDFYSRESLNERIKSKTNNILNFVQKQIKKNQKKILKLKLDLDKANSSEIFKLYGELLISNQNINKKMESIEVLNYYTNEYITIPLDKRRFVKENANIYFKKYKKSKVTIIYANKEIKQAENEIEYFTLLKSQIENCEELNDVLEIQNELIKEKYLIKKKQPTKLQKTKILTFDFNGYLVYVGKNNIQNETVTHELSNKNDLWFHVKDAPGSHVLLKKEGDYTESDIRNSAMLAAYYSTYKDSSSVAVNYTKVKFIKKIPGKRKCFVSISHEKTIFIDPDINIINKFNKI